MINFIKKLFKRRKQLDVSVCPNCKGTGYISSHYSVSLCFLCNGKK